MDKKRDVIVSEEVYWALVKRKFTDQYRSIDEVLRPMLGICPGARARTRSYEREMEYMKEKLSDGDPSGECPRQGFGFATRTQGEAIILSFFREIRFLYETVLKGGDMPAPVVCPHCHNENVRRRESVGKDDHGKALYKYSKIFQCRQCGAQLDRDLPGRVLQPGQMKLG